VALRVAAASAAEHAFVAESPMYDLAKGHNIIIIIIIIIIIMALEMLARQLLCCPARPASVAAGIEQTSLHIK